MSGKGLERTGKDRKGRGKGQGKDEEERGGKEGKRGEKRGKREGKEGEGEGRKGILKLEVDEGGYFFRHEFNYYLDYDKERD